MEHRSPPPPRSGPQAASPSAARDATGDDSRPGDDAPADSVEQLLGELRRAFLRSHQVGQSRASELAQRITVLESELTDMEKLLVTTERQASRLANLYVAAYQLHASLDPLEVRAAVGEIAVNLLGAQACVLLLALDPGASGYETINVATEALAPAPFDRPRYHGGEDALVDASLADGGVRFGPAPGSGAVAVVPLAVQGQVLGALVILRLLPHKASLHREDRELLDLLGAHAASALLGAHVFHETQRKLRTLEGLVALLRRT
jgi:GAF domain-containing protein